MSVGVPHYIVPSFVPSFPCSSDVQTQKFHRTLARKKVGKIAFR